MLEESGNMDTESSVASDNAGSEINNKIVTKIEESGDGSVKPSLPLGM